LIHKTYSHSQSYNQKSHDGYQLIISLGKVRVQGVLIIQIFKSNKNAVHLCNRSPIYSTQSINNNSFNTRTMLKNEPSRRNSTHFACFSLSFIWFVDRLECMMITLENKLLMRNSMTNVPDRQLTKVQNSL